MKSNYTIAEEYVLPSGGKIYDTPFDPHVKLRSMTLADEMKRQSSGKRNTINATLCEIIDDCLVTKLPISVYDMAYADFEYLLHKLRVVTYGPDYKMIVGCPECQAKGVNHLQNVTIDMDKDLLTLDLDTDEAVKNFLSLRSFKLPRGGQDIKLKLPTPRTEDIIQNKVDEFEKHNPNYQDGDTTPMFTLETLIDTIDGEKYSYIELQEFIKRLPAADYNVIMKHIGKINESFGVVKVVDCKCQKCGNEFKTLFRITSEFFGPSID